MSWAPPSTLEEKLKRALFPPRLELVRIVRRELTKGEPELRLIPLLAPPDRAALDIGANRGVWTHVLSKQVDCVHAFEPNPKIFRILEAALPDNAQAHQLGLSDRAGKAELEIPRGRRGWSNQHASLNPARNAGRDVSVCEVEVASLDDLTLPRTGFIKIDVEGHEIAVLNGARGLIARDRPRLIVELEERHTGLPIGDSLAFIQGLGYAAYFLRRGVLTPISAFDAISEHRDAVDSPGYIYNFIFLPR